MSQSVKQTLRRAGKTKPSGPLRQELSPKTTAVVVAGLLVAVGVFGIGWRALGRVSITATAPQEMPKVVKEQVTGEFDPKAKVQALPGETTQEGALRRERLEAIKNQPPTTPSQPNQ